MGSRRTWAGVAALLVLASCTLTTSLDGLSGGDDAPPGDDGGDEAIVPTTPPGEEDGGSDATLFQDVATEASDGCSLAGCFDMPANFSLVAFSGVSRASACPTGFGASTDTVESPSVKFGGCTCGTCSITTAPTCPVNGTIVGHFDTAGSGLCDNAGGNMVNTGCGTDGFLGPFAVANEHKFTPPGATGGACTTPTAKDNTKLQFGAQGRFCQATTVPGCNAKVCPPIVGDPFKTCIASAGNVACPSGFPDKHVIGSSGTFSCSNTCGCSAGGTCKGHLDYFATPNCAGVAGFTAAVDNTCIPTTSGADGGDVFGSHAYTPDPITGVTCTKSGSTSATTNLAQQTTICCN